MGSHLTGMMFSLWRFAELQNQNSTWKDSVRIDINSYCPDIPRTLYAVYNMPNSLLKDTIMNLFGFSDFNNHNVNPDHYGVFEPDSSHSIGSALTPETKPRTKHFYLQANRYSTMGCTMG
jgi:hypothetical protein